MRKLVIEDNGLKEFRSHALDCISKYEKDHMPKYLDKNEYRWYKIFAEYSIKNSKTNKVVAIVTCYFTKTQMKAIISRKK